MREKITKRTVEAVASGRRDVFLWDNELRGFGCKVTPTGSRIYVLQYSLNNRDHRVTIGRHGVDVTAEQARQEAWRLRGVVAAGENPTYDPARDRAAALTVADLGDRYMIEHAMPHKKPSGVAQDRRNLENHIVPLIGNLLLSEVEREHIGRVMRDVAGGKTAKDEKTKPQGRRIVRGGEIVANRVKALLSKMFEFAEERKMRPAGSNPCRGVKRYGEHKVERFLSSEELARLGRALLAVERGGLQYSDGAVNRTKAAVPMMGVKNGLGSHPKTVPLWKNPIAVAAIRLLLFTGCRVGEILNLQWQHVDLERRLLRLPDSKTGAKVVYLSEAAVTVLSAIPRKESNPYVIVGSHPGKPLRTVRKPWHQICKVAKLEHARLHDLRHSFASIGAAGGLSLPMIGALLGHSQPTTTARYAHLIGTPLHQAVDTIGGKLLAAMQTETKGVLRD
jgi:integrase